MAVTADASEGHNIVSDDSLVQVVPPQVSESLAELAESTEPMVEEGNTQDGQEQVEGDEEV